jgi:hypothetical protein
VCGFRGPDTRRRLDPEVAALSVPLEFIELGEQQCGAAGLDRERHSLDGVISRCRLIASVSLQVSARGDGDLDTACPGAR